MNKRSRSYRWLLLFALVLLEVVACRPAGRVFLDTGPLVPAEVVRVTDGDTIEVRIDNNKYRVNYIGIAGIDTPATLDNTGDDGTFAERGLQRIRELVGGQTVYLEKDVSETGDEDVLLRYVWLEDGKMVNSLLVAQGYARTAIRPPDVLYAGQLRELEAEARKNGLGLWGLVPDAQEEQSKAEPVY